VASLDRCNVPSAIAVPGAKNSNNTLFLNKKIYSHDNPTGLSGFVWNVTKGPALSGRTQILKAATKRRKIAGAEIQAIDQKRINRDEKGFQGERHNNCL
jgi:hypothetical protein